LVFLFVCFCFFKDQMCPIDSPVLIVKLEVGWVTAAAGDQVQRALASPAVTCLCCSLSHLHSSSRQPGSGIHWDRHSGRSLGCSHRRAYRARGVPPACTAHIHSHLKTEVSTMISQAMQPQSTGHHPRPQDSLTAVT
jgi:hypothetical protein